MNNNTELKNEISYKAKKNEEMKIYIIHFHLCYIEEKTKVINWILFGATFEMAYWPNIHFPIASQWSAIIRVPANA